MPPTSAHSDQTNVAARKADHSKNPQTMLHCVPKIHNIHLRRLRHVIVVLQLLIHVRFEACTIRHLVIWRIFSLRITKHNGSKNNVFPISPHDIFHAQLKSRIQHLLNDQLQLFTVRQVNQAILENPLHLVHPEPQHVLLLFIQTGLRQVQALHDFRDISDVEKVMALLRGGQETFLNDIVQLHRCSGDQLRKLLHIIPEVIELVGCQGQKDTTHISLVGIHKVQQVESALQAS
mmetsp:Transcript_35043/g.78446  ORF Transcript_35043/g.78446 Transcript_35043/m.78446 type:complete len:234 (+) Transcript_35043:5071-5772(+)